MCTCSSLERSSSVRYPNRSHLTSQCIANHYESKVAPFPHLEIKKNLALDNQLTNSPHAQQIQEPYSHTRPPLDISSPPTLHQNQPRDNSYYLYSLLHLTAPSPLPPSASPRYSALFGLSTPHLYINGRHASTRHVPPSSPRCAETFPLRPGPFHADDLRIGALVMLLGSLRCGGRL